MIVAEIEVRVSELERNVDRVMTKLDMFIEESRAARQRQDAEMREARQKHDADMKEIRERQEAAQAKHDADMKEIRTENQGVLKQIQNLVLASMGLIIASVVGIMAIAVGVLGILWTTARSMQPPPPSQSVYQLPPNTPPE